MSTCTDNPRLGQIGCGATYSGRSQHSVARAAWSEHPDGRAHITFTGEAASDACWAGGVLRDPATLTGRNGEPVLEQDERGRWRKRRRIGVADGPNSDERAPRGVLAP